MAQILPTFAPTIAPTSHVRVQLINPEPLVIWDQSQFNDLSSEELLLEAASQQHQEEEEAAARTPLRQGSSSSNIGFGGAPPLEIVLRKRLPDVPSQSLPPSPRSPRKPTYMYMAPSAHVLSRRRSSSRSCDTTKKECDSSSIEGSVKSAPTHPSLPMIMHPPPSMPPPSMPPLPPPPPPSSIDVAVPLAVTPSAPIVEQEPQPSDSSSAVMGFLHERFSTFESNIGVLTTANRRVVEQQIPKSGPLGRFLEARVTTFLKNVEFLTGLQVSSSKTKTTKNTAKNPQLLLEGDSSSQKESHQQISKETGKEKAEEEASVALTEASKIRDSRQPTTTTPQPDETD
ncbi:expressed unknown protein [Seminavis robusta]|uniref:Uncharacterized protein n=1 Tax=Seminavis robusta TaxID=568900 RepID=A0A9N8DMD3_9STRA|nr:expressed unknown protein [Seminavis robusta]|eukprot:Sro205_g086390.1 n/a (343) ;mRNA; r:90128-91156